MNEDVDGNRKLLWKEMSNVKGGKVESCSRKNDGNGRWHKDRKGVGKSILKIYII